MPRPTRLPGVAAQRLTIYIAPETKRRLIQQAADTHASPGEIIDRIIIELADGFTVAPLDTATSGANVPVAHAGQPGVEHRAAALPIKAAVRDFYDHPGWKLSATGQNVCIRCGKTKIRSKNASCEAPR